MTDFRTISPDELAELAEIPEGLRALVFSPGGPIQALPYEQLLTKLIAADLAKPSKAALDADLAHPVDSVALVFSDPVASSNGWYRKLGASGAGSWSQFEELARNSRLLAEAAAATAQSAATTSQAASATALAASGPNHPSTEVGLAAVSLGQTFAVDEGRWIGVYRKDAGPVATLLRRFPKDPVPASYVTDQVLTLEQFASPGSSYYQNPGDRGTDWTPALMAALDAINRYAPVNARWPRVPRIELGLGAYFFGQRIEQKVAAHLRGQGGGHDDFNGGTRFMFPTATQGWTVNDSNTLDGTDIAPTTSAIGTILEGIQFESEGGGTGWDINADTSTELGAAAAANTFGLWLRATCTVRDCVLKGWKGNGAQIIAFAGGAGGLRGNANGVKIDRLTVREDGAGTPSAGHGVFVYGSDANTCNLSDVQIRHAGLIGIFELNTLGNTWVNPRVDDFGRVARATNDADLGCYYSGFNYVLIDWRPGIGAATTPGTNASVWYPIQAAGAASSLYPAWSGSGTYVCMLPFLFQGQSVTSTVENPYIEGGIPGHAGGNPSDPGTSVTVYGGQSQWTNTTSRVYSVPSFGRGVASNSGFVARRPSILGSSEATNFGAYTEARLGDAAGEFLRARIERGGEVNYFHRFNAAGDIVFERDGQPPFWYATSHLTARQNGRGAADPHSIGFPGLVLVDPSDSGNNRHVNCGLAAPTTGARARGEVVWNAAPGAGRPDYWECIASGTPGTWIGRNVLPFQSGAASSALTGSTSETVLATLSLPGGTLGPNGAITIDALWSHNANANAKTLRARLGGLSGVAFGISQASATSLSARLTGYLQNRNSVSSQVGSSGAAFTLSTAAVNTGALNTANNWDIVITGQLGVGTDSMTLEGFTIRIEPGA